MGKTKIEWTATVNPDGTVTQGRTWNPTRGCALVSEGCRHCYAMKFAHRFSGAGRPYEGLTEIGPDGPRWTGKVVTLPDRLDEPRSWRKPSRIFVNSMSDLFHEDVPEEFIGHVFTTMFRCRQHTFQILTKRPAEMLDLIGNAETRWGPFAEGHWPLPNVWLGVSVEDQKTADERIPLLLQTPAAVRFVSYEPAIGPVEFDCGPGKAGPHRYFSAEIDHPEDARIDWVICGGESGPGARPMHPDWARSARDQCVAAGVPFFFKQHGAWLHRDAMTDQQFQLIDQVENLANTSQEYFRVGKKAAGRLLDGREWNELPKNRIISGGE